MTNLIDLCEMPKKQKTIVEYLTLFEDITDKNKKIAKITEELIQLNFPIATKQQ